MKPLALVLLLLAPTALADVIRVPADLPFQAALDAAAPGDTVLVASGGYPDPVTVNRAVLVMPDPDLDGPAPILAGVTGSAATLRGFVFDGDLDPTREPALVISSGLSVEECSFRNLARGLQANGGDTYVGDCVFTDVSTGIHVDPGAEITVEASSFLDLPLGIHSVGTVPPASARAPHPECSEFGITLIACSFTGGQLAIWTHGLVGTRVISATIANVQGGILIYGGCLSLEESVLAATDIEPGTGVELTTSWGRIVRTQISEFTTGILVADDNRPTYTSGVIGGTSGDANAIAGNDVNLVLDQPEEIDANYNFWGTTDCGSLGIDGMTPTWIVDGTYANSINCLVPVRPVTWGALKSRFAAP